PTVSRSSSPATTTAPTARGSGSSRGWSRIRLSATPAAERLRDEFGRQLGNGRRDEFGRGLVCADGYAMHARGHRGLHAGHRILKHQNVAWAAVQLGRSSEKAFRVRLAVGDVFLGDQEADQLAGGTA